MDEEIEKIIPPKLPSKLAKHIYKEIDGFKRLLSKTSGINVEFLGSIKDKCSKCGKNHLQFSMYSCLGDQ